MIVYHTSELMSAIPRKRLAAAFSMKLFTIHPSQLAEIVEKTKTWKAGVADSEAVA
jgi:hypothetical protein